MSLTQALSTALSGLQVNQASISIVAANVANADTPGYTRKVVNQVAIGGSASIGVRVSDIQREIDLYIQRQLRVENAGASYADTRANMYSQLQDIYGQPGADTSLESVYNSFTSALQVLSTSPDDPGARTAVVNSAQLLTQQLNQLSGSVQALRANAELGIADAVNKANEAMSQIASLNGQIAAGTPGDAATEALQDQRDSYIDQLSQLMDINVIPGDRGQVSIFTSSGTQLVGAQAAQLSFDAVGTITPNSLWSANPSQRGVGTITLIPPAGAPVDLIQNHSIRSGTIAAYLQMRDQDLVKAQNQLDALAAGMAQALSDKTTAGSPVSSPPQNGFSVDVGNLSNGNTVTVNYTDTATNTPHTITLVRADDPSALPLSNTATATANDTVFGIDFSGGMGSVVTQINAALTGTGMTASNSGTVLQILDDGAANTVDVNSLSATATVTSLTSGGAELPLFTDGSTPYTGIITGTGPESRGLAARIAVNPSIVADPSSLIVYQAGTPAGDSTRPDFILQQLTNASLTFSPNTGIGTVSAPFTGSLTTYLRQVISQQGEAASSADNLKQGQDVVLNSLQQRFNDVSGVNVDQEMANLLSLQNSYAANARVMSAVKDMLDALINM
ncbi:MAG TPA: flagellar hook-associated protein FlgK [Pseudolabrys sp.]|jgi:flagellar hook-associated protein 1 FlgK|nr:flagellar hook-associated protein FlgK [Pseudolabrys sp.]